MSEKIELMHQIYGKKEGNYICWNCHFCHWKIEGKGEDKHMGYKWCEVYGINKDNVLDTEWSLKYPACGYFNVCKDAPTKNVWKIAKREVNQISLF